MTHKHLRIIIIFGTVVLGCLMVIQVYWFKRAFDVAERQFDHSVQVALKRVGDSVAINNPQPAEVKKLSSGFFLVVANSDLDAKKVDSLIKKEFLLRGFDLDYELGIYNADDDTLVYGNYVHSTKRKLIEEAFAARSAPLSEKNFAVYFPKKKSYLAAELNIWIFSTAVLLLMIGFFAYAIFSLLREKRFSDLKNDFVNNMTHELKTPVTNIRIAGEILMGKITGDEGSKVYLDILQKENEKLQAKIDRLLMAATGNYLNNVAFEKVDIHRVLAQCAEAFQLKVSERKGNIQLRFDARNPVVHGDQDLLMQALCNVVDNAEKYSPHRPEIIIQTLEDANGIEIKIRDRGIGIPHDMQLKVFDKFFRVQSGNIHNVKGFGLGLNFVGNVIKAHQGNVRLVSEVKGTEVSIFLPKLGRQ